MTDTSPGANKSDYTFGQIAIRENICNFDHVKECLDIQSKLRTLGIEPKKLGEILIEKGYLTPDQAVQIAKLQVQSASSSSKLSIPGYELISRIGQGAMGTVYKAKQVSMDRVVAIKVLSPRYSKDRTFVERFLREARAVAKLNHENIITGIDVGEANGHHYFVMEFVDGAPVTSLMKRDGRVEEQRCLRIAIQVARALAHAHKNGIVHRDIKPENVMLTGAGAAKLCDLGLAKQTKGDAEVTMDGTSVGTPNYISPEQARGEDKIDIRSDIYSLGASLYHMAVGAPPFSGANPMVVMTKHVTEFPESPRKRYPALSEGFSNLVMKMMQKRREDRPQDPEALIHDLERLLNGESVAAPAAHAPHRSPTQVPRPVTHHGHRPPTSVILPPRSKSSPAGLIAIMVIGALAIVGAVVFFAGSDSSGDAKPVVLPPRPVAPPPVNATGNDPEERAKKDVQRFRDLVESQFGNTAKADRFTEPYATVLKMIEKSKASADFAAQKAWQDELGAYTSRVNGLIMSRYYGPIKARAEENYNSGRYLKALDDLSKFEEVYKYLRNDDKVELTQAGKEHAELISRVDKGLTDSYLASKLQADQAFRDPKRRDEAYSLLDAAADSGTAEQRESIERDRLNYLHQDVVDAMKGASGTDAAGKGADRIAALRKLHPKNTGVLAQLDKMSEKLRSDASQATSAATSQAMALYGGTFRPAFDEALKRRDIVAARKALYDLYFAPTSSQFQTLFLPASADYTMLKAFLDPSRGAASDAAKVAAAAEQGIDFTAMRASSYEAARELYVDLRIVALLEELLEQAAAGAPVASRDASKFKTGYSPLFASASQVDAVPRRAGEEPVLSAAVGTQKILVPLAPAGKQAATEDDIVALAKRAPSASADALFPLKAFYLYVLADRNREAKDWYDKLGSPKARIGTERYVDRLKGLTSAREEDDAKTAFKDAWDLYYKKKDAAGGAKKFKEILDRYAGTDYMKSKVPPNNRTRLEILQDLFGPADGKPKGLKPGVRELFAGADVKDLGRGRYEVTYSAFKDDKDIALFTTTDGQVTLQRTQGGFGLQGNGVVTWNPPLKGNASIEVSFRNMGDGAIGLLLAADGSKTGYLAVADLPIPGLQPLDAIFRLPIKEGAQMLNSIVAQGGTGIQVTKNTPTVASLTREGNHLRFTVGRGELNGDSPQPADGHVGIGVLNTGILVDRIKIIGEIDPAWLDAAK
ncbi:MAG: serine/threonine protein kinase [Planctomycetaceae bacterium]|nr:serine/threonine protein kinase [Planctomycetaceae bacterium]